MSCVKIGLCLFVLLFFLLAIAKQPMTYFKAIPIATNFPSLFRPQISDLPNEWVPR